MCEKECTFWRLHVYLHVFRIAYNSTKMTSLKIAIVSISVLASGYSAIKVEEPLRNLLTLAVIFKKIILNGD